MAWKIMNDTVQADPVQVADEAADVRAEGQTVADEGPLNADDPQKNEVLHDGGQDIF